MKRFLTQVLAYVLLISFFNSHILGPVSATLPDGCTDGQPSSSTARAPLLGDFERLGVPSNLRPLLQEMWKDAEAIPAAERPKLPHVQYLLEERIKQQEGALARWGVRAISAVAATLAAVAIGELFMFSSAVTILILPNMPPGTPIPPIPAELWGAGIAAGVLVLPEAYAAAHKGLGWLVRAAQSQKEEDASSGPSQQPKSRSWSKTDVAYVAGMVGFLAATVGKTLFTYIQDNLPPIPAGIAVLVAIAGVPYLGTLFWQAHQTFKNGWSSYVSPKSTPAREDFRDHVTAGFRKTKADSASALRLYQELEEIDAFVKKTTEETNTKLATLADETKIADLKARLRSYHQMVDLLKLQRLYQFAGDTEGADKKYQTPDDVKNKDKPKAGKRKSRWSRLSDLVFGQHPLPDKIVKGGAMVVSSAVYGAEYYALWFILTSFGIPPAVATGVAAILDVPLGTQLIASVGNQVRKIVRLLTGYHPVERERTITDPHINQVPMMH